MTSLVAWIGIDSRAPASMYLVSDSRISWQSGKIVWDFGRKLFASQKHPELLGFVGDVLFPSQVLGQIVALIDADLLFTRNESCQSKWEKVVQIVKQSYATYPKEPNQTFTIIYCTRENSGMESTFHLASLSWRRSHEWIDEGWATLPHASGIIKSYGSGGKAVEKWLSYWNNTSNKGTSRIVFSAFCDALISNEDKRSGGAPQLVGLYRIGSAKSFGVVFNNQRFMLGVPLQMSHTLENIEWRNALFERCDWRTMKKLQIAQKHNSPRGLAK